MISVKNKTIKNQSFLGYYFSNFCSRLTFSIFFGVSKAELMEIGLSMVLREVLEPNVSFLITTFLGFNSSSILWKETIAGSLLNNSFGNYSFFLTAFSLIYLFRYNKNILSFVLISSSIICPICGTSKPSAIS